MTESPPGWVTMHEDVIPNDMLATREDLFHAWALVWDMDPVDLGRCMLVRSYPSFQEVGE